MTEKENNWWESIIDTLSARWEQENPKLKEVLKNLQLERRAGKLFAQTPDGHREVHFTSVSGTPVIAYVRRTSPDNRPIISCLAVPGLPWHEITRNGSLTKAQWTDDD